MEQRPKTHTTTRLHLWRRQFDSTCEIYCRVERNHSSESPEKLFKITRIFSRRRQVSARVATPSISNHFSKWVGQRTVHMKQPTPVKSCSFFCESVAFFFAARSTRKERVATCCWFRKMVARKKMTPSENHHHWWRW